MKCEHCGNNLSLEDKVCPYCGKENKLASRHNSDMAKYEKDYTSVKKEVLSNSRRFNSFTARLTIIAVLIALIASALVAVANKYDIRDYRKEKLILAHIDEHKAALNDLIEARDFPGVNYYYRANDLSYHDSLNDYYIAYTASDKYSGLMDQIYYLYENGSYNKPEESFERIASIAQQLEDMREPQTTSEKEKHYSNEETVAYVNDLVDHSELLIKGHFELNDEDMDEFITLSKAKKQIMLEEAWTNEK